MRRLIALESCFSIFILFKKWTEVLYLTGPLPHGPPAIIGTNPDVSEEPGAPSWFPTQVAGTPTLRAPPAAFQGVHQPEAGIQQ